MAAYFLSAGESIYSLFLVSLWVYEVFITRKAHRWWLLATALIVPAIPLIRAQLKGELSYRLQEVAIWDHNYLKTIVVRQVIFLIYAAFFSIIF